MKRTRKTDGSDKVQMRSRFNRNNKPKLFTFPIIMTEVNLPSSQKETKSSPLAQVHDKEAESSSKGRQNITLG